VSSSLTISDPDEIRTMRPIPKKEIIKVIRWDGELQDLRVFALTFSDYRWRRSKTISS
jgi:hypothetical protein